MESRKMVLRNLFAGSNGDADTESQFVDTVGEERRDELKEEHGNLCKIDSQWEFAA